MNCNPEHYLLPGNHIALACSDAAGTNACFAIAEMYKSEKRELPLLFSNANNFPDCYFNHIIREIPDFNNLKIDCLFTGTSHPVSSDSFEVKCIIEAQKANIYTISFIDHWTNFKLRFKGLEEGQLPDEIWVVNTKARALAINEGLPKEKLLIRSNPYHCYLKNYWHSDFHKKSYLLVLDIPKEGFHILFAPDPLSIRKRNDEIGFSEVDALKDILEVLAPLGKQVFLIIKTHPLQPIDVLEEVLKGNKDIQYKLIIKADGPELIHAADLVIGFYSNMLLEAQVLNKNVIRYFPGRRSADPLKNSVLKKVCYSESELKMEINTLIHG